MNLKGNRILKGIKNRVKRQGLAMLKLCIRLGVFTPQNKIKYYPVLVNSIPKSGTHLLSNIVKCIPNMNYYGDFIASTPSLSLREVPMKKIRTKLMRLLPNEIAHSHLYYDIEYSKILSDLEVRHLLIIRDPRDILCSEVEYLTSMAPWHAMHKYFRRLDNLNDRIALGIKGIRDKNSAISYDRIELRIGSYLGWMDDPGCFVVRYEELNGENKKAKVREIIEHLTQGTISEDSMRSIEAHVAKNTSPIYSHTFNKGTVGRWKSVLNEESKDLFKKYSGDILFKLGYEDDANW